MQKITPFLWFDNNAEEAVNHYLSSFKNSKINKILRCGDAGPGRRDPSSPSPSNSRVKISSL